jgi:type VI secretion system secreted protein VgrG
MADAPKLMRLKTTLGDDKLRFRGMKAREELARLYEFDVQALADDADIRSVELLGKPACVTLKLRDSSDRHFHGLVCAIGVADELEKGAEYRLVLRPWLWLLTRRKDSRVFQDMSVVDIAKKVFEDYPENNCKFDLNAEAELPKYDYCVQYRETDFDFVSRLFEREGLYYYFRHEEDKHTLVVVDSKSRHEDCPGEHEFRWRSSADLPLYEEPITQWHSRRELQAGKWTLNEFNFRDLKAPLLKSATSAVDRKNVKLEIYDYPGEYRDGKAGDRYARLRSEETDARHALVEGAGSLSTMACGHQFTLLGHPDAAENKPHLVLSTDIEMGYSGYEAGAGEDYFRCRFSAIPADVQFRPERIAPKAVVPGPQTATVVGPKGEEIHVDKFGRVKLQFHWDRMGKRDQDSSCWVRVSQGSAGNGWGMVWLPRIGQEVVVDFLEGNPDRPLVTGRVYNVENMPPYTLPDHKTVSTVKSRSTKEGGVEEFNEIRFEDEKGKEYLLIQAQKNKREIVKHTSWTRIGKDEHRTVEGDRLENVGGSYDLNVGKDIKQQVGGALSLDVGKDMRLQSGGVYALSAARDITSEAGTAYSIQAGSDMHVKVGNNLGVDAGMNVHIKGGMNIVIEAGMTVTLKAGPSSVVLGPDGVSVTGPLVKINSGGAPGAGGGARPVAPDSPEEPEDAGPPKDPLKHR